MPGTEGRPPDPEPDEVRALARLAFDELSAMTAGIWTVHRAIARRAFGANGPAARPAHTTHDAIAGGVYGAVRGTTRVIGQAADLALAQRPPSGRRELSTTSKGSAVLAAVNGLIGDVLAREGSVLSEPLGLRVDGHAIAPEPDALAAAFPAATPRLVVFLHGLMETEFAWRHGAGAGREPYGDRLARELGVTPVYVRFNAGLHISENGRALDELLERVVAAWPVAVAQIALVGHSMGGLVARSAGHQASERGASWVRHVRHVVSLGTPHMGAPLEQLVHVGSAALSVFPESRPFGTFLRRRSGGIRDLRHGSLVDEDWRDRDPDGLRAAATSEVPLLDHAAHFFVSATLTRSPKHPLGRFIGDLLVLPPSAAGKGRTRRIPFAVGNGLHVGGASHFALLNHPEIYEHLREWLAAVPVAAQAGQPSG